MVLELKQTACEFIFEQDKYFSESHASTLAQLPNGDIAVAWFGGSKEGQPDVNIWQSIRCGNKWSRPRLIAQQQDMPHWNPVYMTDGHKLYLFYRTGHIIADWESWLKVSDDNGQTYSEPEKLPKGFLGPIKNKPIKMSNGKWLLPSSVETETKWYCRMEILDLDHRQWFKTEPIESDDEPCRIIQPTTWESQKGNIHALLRSSMGSIYRSDSLDYGVNWSKPYKTNLPNPDSGIDCTRLDNNNIVLVYNPNANQGMNIVLNKRTPLVIAVSSDNGLNWQEAFVLEDEPGEYSYPAVIKTSEGISLTYTWNRKKIKYCSFKIV